MKISSSAKKYIGNKIFADYFNQYAEIVNNYGYKVKMANGIMRSLQADKLGANAGFFKKSAIIVTPEWVYQLVTNSDKARIALLGTLGHEMSHKMGNIKGIRKFELWTNEVHCDFKGASLTLNSERRLLLESMHNKIQLGHKDIDNKDCTHPSWKQRIEYASQYDYNEELIRKIAEDTKCSNEKRIQKVIKQFDPIILK